MTDDELDAMGGSMTDDELDAIEARAAAATPGPWMGPRITDDWPPGWVGVYAAYDDGEPEPFAVIGVTGRYDEENVDNNAAFIAHARTDVEKLTAEVRRLRGPLLRNE